MAEPVTFWYGCNVLRHGDIIHACLDILRAIGFEASPVGGPDYCCGTVKDAYRAAARRALMQARLAQSEPAPCG